MKDGVKCKERGKEYELKRGEERKKKPFGEGERERSNGNRRRMREGQLTFRE